MDDGLAAEAEAALRIMLVDDHDLFRNGLRRLLDDLDGIVVVAAEARGEAAVKRAGELHPDVVVMDIKMPGMSGIEATRRLLEVSPGSAVLMLTGIADEDAVLDAVIAGASGYLLKDAPLPEIERAIRAAATGDSVVAPGVAGCLLARLRHHGPPPQPEARPDVSPREMEVLRLVVAGCENGEIAERLHLSVGAVKHHVASTLDKLCVANRVQAAVLAVRLGLVDEQDA